MAMVVAIILAGAVVGLMAVIAVWLIVAGSTDAYYGGFAVAVGAYLLFPTLVMAVPTGMLLIRRRYARWVYAIAAAGWAVACITLFRVAQAPMEYGLLVSAVPVVAAVLTWLPASRTYYVLPDKVTAAAADQVNQISVAESADATR